MRGAFLSIKKRSSWWHVKGSLKMFAFCRLAEQPLYKSTQYERNRQRADSDIQTVWTDLNSIERWESYECRILLLTESWSPSFNIVNMSYLVLSSGIGWSRFQLPQAKSKKLSHGLTAESIDFRTLAAETENKHHSSQNIGPIVWLGDAESLPMKTQQHMWYVTSSFSNVDCAQRKMICRI
jgi:hypothetical protein